MAVPVRGYERYTIESDGTITNTHTGRVLKPIKAKNGYVHADLYDGKGGHKIFLVHRLVAEHFIPNPEQLPVVNHKDENPLNNNADNLEWCTNEYNSNFGTIRKRTREKMDPFYRSEAIKSQARINGSKRCKRVFQYAKDGKLLGMYMSGKEASRATSADHSHIIDCCNGKRQSAGGFVWKYEGSEDL